MNTTNFRFLQLNIMNSRAGIKALVNDPVAQDLDILLIKKTPISASWTHVNHCHFATINVRTHSLIYVNKRMEIARSARELGSSAGLQDLTSTQG